MFMYLRCKLAFLNYCKTGEELKLPALYSISAFVFQLHHCSNLIALAGCDTPAAGGGVAWHFQQAGVPLQQKSSGGLLSH